MKQAETVKVEVRDGVIHVSGALTLTTARAALDATAGAFNGASGALTFDLAGVKESDSAALAVLLEWMRRAAAQRLGLVYRNVPERLGQLARISDLETVLGIGSGA